MLADGYKVKIIPIKKKLALELKYFRVYSKWSLQHNRSCTVLENEDIIITGFWGWLTFRGELSAIA